MTAHGFETLITDRRPARFAAPSDTNWFVGGYLDRGPVGEPVLLTSMTQKEALMGPRTADTAILHDSLETFFRIGGRNAYVLRFLGEDYATSEETIIDVTVEEDPAVKATAPSPGVWGDKTSLVITNPTGSTWKVVVQYDSEPVEESPVFDSVEEGVVWALDNSNYVRFEDLEAGIPEAGTYTLSGGDDDLETVDTDLIAEYLKLFTRDLGPGMVALPGMTSASIKEELLAHAWEMKRNPYLDSPNVPAAARAGGSPDTLASPAIALRTKAGAQLGGEFWPWAEIPGVAYGTTRQVPFSAVQAGMTAMMASRGSAPGDPVAGALSETSWVVGLTQVQPTDEEREILSNAGINVAIMYRGNVRQWDNRTLANPLTNKNWSQLSQARIVTAIAAIAEEVQADYYQRKIDGRNFTLHDYGMELKGRACMPFFLSNDLFGESEEEAFKVNVGPDVNPPADLANGILRAVIELKTSPGADYVKLELVKVPTSDSI